MCNYVDQGNDPVAMLVTKGSAGVKSLINLKNPLHTGDEAHK